jgi:hypothetical protein
MSYDWPTIVADLEQLLKLRSIPFGMQLFERRADMEAIPRIRRPQTIHTLDQVVGQASRLGWTVGSPATTWSAPSAARWWAWARPRPTTGSPGGR